MIFVVDTVFKRLMLVTSLPNIVTLLYFELITVQSQISFSNPGGLIM